MNRNILTACCVLYISNPFLIRNSASRNLSSALSITGNRYASLHQNRNSREISNDDWIGIGQSQGIRLTDDNFLLDMHIDPENRLYVAGNFSLAGGTPVFNIACWDGNLWEAVGETLLMRMITALAVDTGGALHAAGWFASGNHNSSCTIARWNGTGWTIVTDDVIGNIYALAFDRNNQLFASGDFDTIGTTIAHNVARWDGNRWFPLGEGTNNRTLALQFDTSGILYAGGYFDSAGTGSARYIAQWNGNGWHPLGNGIVQNYHERSLIPVASLAIDSSNNLYVGGDFDSAGMIAARNIARWNGSEWSALGSGISYRSAGSVTAISFDRHGTLFAAGLFDSAGTVAAANTARWDGDSWKPLGNGTNGRVVALSIDSCGNLFAAGIFTMAGEIYSDNIACWNGSGWSAVGQADGRGLNGEVSVLAATTSGDLYFGGQFTTAGPHPMCRIGKISATAWSTPGSGQPARITALLPDPPDRLFSVYQSSPQQFSIDHWNGSAWISVGNCIGHSVNALARSATGTLIAGGLFSSCNNRPAENIVSWNGFDWQPFDGTTDHTIYALLHHNDALYIGGDFDSAAAVSARSIVCLTGNEWKALGSGIDGRVLALAVDSTGTLYAGGEFTLAESNQPCNIARWDGAAWYPLGTGVKGTVSAITIDRSGELYCGGTFDSSGSVRARNIARWDGTVWHALGSGTDTTVIALGIGPAGHLYAGGSFLKAGGKVSPCLSICKLPSSDGAISRTGGSGQDVLVVYAGNGVYEIEVAVAATLNWSLHSLSGRKLLTHRQRVAPGKHRVFIEHTDIANGVYVVQIRAGSTMFRRRLIIGK